MRSLRLLLSGGAISAGRQPRAWAGEIAASCSATSWRRRANLVPRHTERRPGPGIVAADQGGGWRRACSIRASPSRPFRACRRGPVELPEAPVANAASDVHRQVSCTSASAAASRRALGADILALWRRSAAAVDQHPVEDRPRPVPGFALGCREDRAGRQAEGRLRPESAASRRTRSMKRAVSFSGSPHNMKTSTCGASARIAASEPPPP